MLQALKPHGKPALTLWSSDTLSKAGPFSWIGCRTLRHSACSPIPLKSSFNPARSEREFEGHEAVASRLRVDVDLRNFLPTPFVEVSPTIRAVLGIQEIAEVP